MSEREIDLSFNARDSEGREEKRERENELEERDIRMKKSLCAKEKSIYLSMQNSFSFLHLFLSVSLSLSFSDISTAVFKRFFLLQWVQAQLLKHTRRNLPGRSSHIENQVGNFLIGYSGLTKGINLKETVITDGRTKWVICMGRFALKEIVGHIALAIF